MLVHHMLPPQLLLVPTLGTTPQLLPICKAVYMYGNAVFCTDFYLTFGTSEFCGPCTGKIGSEITAFLTFCAALIVENTV